MRRVAACISLGGQRPDTAERLMRSRYTVNGKAGRLHEVSRFILENGAVVLSGRRDRAAGEKTFPLASPGRLNRLHRPGPGLDFG